MVKKKRVFADILSLLLLSVSVISLIPSFIDFEKLLDNTNYIIVASLLLLSVYFLFFLVKNIDVAGKGEKVFSSIFVFGFFLLSITSLLFFKNNPQETHGLYAKIKSILPYLFVICQFYSCDSIKDDDKKFEIMMYLTGAYFLIGFFSLDLNGLILASIADLVYCAFKLRKHFFKCIFFLAGCSFLFAITLFSVDSWTGYLKDNSENLFYNVDTVELSKYATFLPSNHNYEGNNYIVSLTNSFGLTGLIVATFLFMAFMALCIKEGVCVPYWIFMFILYVLSFVSIIFSVFNFEFYLFSPSIITIALNACIFGVITNNKGI